MEVQAVVRPAPLHHVQQQLPFQHIYFQAGSTLARPALVREHFRGKAVLPDDEAVLSEFALDKIDTDYLNEYIKELDEQGVFTITYRLVDTGTPVYVNMKINRMRGTNRIILGISVVDSQMKQQVQMENTIRERAVLAQMMAISGDYLSLYSVDPKTNHYIEFTASPEFEQLGIAKEGADFFRNSEENTRNLTK